MVDLVAIEPIVVQMSFDYSEYSDEAGASLKRHAATIREIVVRATDDVGRELYEAKQEIHREKKDGWAKWVETEIGWTVQYADRLIKRYQEQHSEPVFQNSIEPPVESVEEVQGVGNFPTNEDKRQTVRGFFADFPELAHLSNREIARRCGVDHKTVAAIKKELFPEPTLEPTPEPQQPQPDIPTSLDFYHDKFDSESEPEQPQPEQESIPPLVESTAPVDNLPIDVDNLPTSEPEQEEEPIPESEPEQIQEVELEQGQESEPESTEKEIEEPRVSSVPAVLLSSESNEWYTPKRYIDAARALMGKIDVDPASCEEANRIIKAEKFYTIDDSGLNHLWLDKVWLNPPYGLTEGKSNQEIWSRELIDRYNAGEVTEAVLLVNANTEAKWFQPLYEYLICFTDHRIRFYSSDDEANQPTQGNALVYFGMQRKRFIEIFSHFGVVVERARAEKDGHEER